MKRAFEIACAVAAVAVVALYVVVDDDYDLVITTALLGLVAAACVPMVVTNARNAAVPPGLRPQRFEVSPTGFSAPYETDMRLVRTPLLLLFAGFCGLSIGTDNPAFIVITAGLGFALGTSHRQRALVLTPAGITLHTTIFAAPRTLAWGEPLEVPLNLAVNPWFVSAAIQWYAHYPDERPGIGTPAGHDRLREALTAEDPVLPPRPPLPRELVYATWLAYIAVALGVLAGARDLALTTAFLPALRRANEPGLPLGDADLTLLAAVGGFVMAVAGRCLRSACSTRSAWGAMTAPASGWRCCRWPRSSCGYLGRSTASPSGTPTSTTARAS